MWRIEQRSLGGLIFCALWLCGCEPPGSQSTAEMWSEPIRVATFNTSLNRPAAGQLANDLRDGNDAQAWQVAAIVQRVRPDVLLLNEFDYDPQNPGGSWRLFQNLYLAVDQDGQQGIRYPHHFVAPVNTGLPSGFDWDKDGTEDGFGHGAFPGQYGMLVASRYPIDRDAVRTFQHFLWKDMPQAMLPADPETGSDYYGPAELMAFRLSSKSHWDVPIRIGDSTVHFLVCHPTPPVFDGPEDRNGSRNHDEIRLFADYIAPRRSPYIYDDQRRFGGLPPDAAFIIAGDLNADPDDGDSAEFAVRQLIEHPRIRSTPVPSSRGGIEQAQVQAEANAQHVGDAAYDTGDFPDQNVGNLRVDYVLPSRNLDVLDAGVYWPASSQSGFALVAASDHRLVWVDVRLAQ